MRANLIAPALFAAILGLGFTMATAQAEAVKVTPELTVFTKERADTPDGSPTVLRGSATRRGTVYGDSGYFYDYDPRRLQVSAGSTLWQTDPVTGQVFACRIRRTSTVGSRYIDCMRDNLPYTIYD